MIEKDQNLNVKITTALERISSAFRVLLWNEGKESSLSPIQIQILVFLFQHPHKNYTASYLAEEFNLTKATISESLKVLFKKKLVQKAENLLDTRSYFLQLTESGIATAKKSSNFSSEIENSLGNFPLEQQEVLFESLTKLIYDLHQSGHISLQRMCFNCRNYSLKNGRHYCSLLEKNLKNSELRVDCGEFEKV